MFPLHISFSLDLIAITGATALYAWSVRNRGAGSSFAKLVAILVIIFALISIACSVYSGMRFWRDAAMMRDSMHENMMRNNMQNRMMEPGMMNHQTDMNMEQKRDRNR